MHSTTAPSAWDAWLDKEAAAKAEEEAFRKEHEDTYRRLAGNFTRAEQELLRSRDLTSHAQRAIMIAARPRSTSRSPRSRRVSRTATRARSSSSDDLPPRPLGTLHSPVVCAFCGGTSDLRTTVLIVDRAEAAVCEDQIGCVGRRGERGRAT